MKSFQAIKKGPDKCFAVCTAEFIFFFLQFMHNKKTKPYLQNHLTKKKKIIRMILRTIVVYLHRKLVHNSGDINAINLHFNFCNIKKNY